MNRLLITLSLDHQGIGTLRSVLGDPRLHGSGQRLHRRLVDGLDRAARILQPTHPDSSHLSMVVICEKEAIDMLL